MRKPMVVSAHNLARNWTTRCGQDGLWTPARPEACPTQLGLFTRFRTAWRVFTGRYDAIRWHDQ